MNKEATMTDRQLLVKVNEECRRVLAETREIVEQHKLSLDDDAFGYLVHSQTSEEHFFGKMVKEKPITRTSKPVFMSGVLELFEHHKKYVLKICKEGMPQREPSSPVTDYDRSLVKRLRDSADHGHLEMGEDKVYRLTDKGKRYMARSLMFLLRERDMFMHLTAELWSLNGLRDDDSRERWSVYTYHDHHFWSRVRNALLLRMTDEELEILRLPRPKPLKVKVTVPVWVEAVLPLMFEEVRRDNLEGDAEDVARRASLIAKYTKGGEQWQKARPKRGV